MTEPHEIIDVALELYDNRDQAVAILICVLTLLDHAGTDHAAKWEALALKTAEIIDPTLRFDP